MKRLGFAWDKKKFILSEDFIFDTEIKTITYYSKDGMIEIVNGILKIKKEFAWDGMTGFYDGEPDLQNPQYPITWKATLIHDVICKYWNEDNENFPISRFQGDRFFLQFLMSIGFKFSYFYFIFVRLWSILRVIGKFSCTLLYFISYIFGGLILTSIVLSVISIRFLSWVFGYGFWFEDNFSIHE